MVASSSLFDRAVEISEEYLGPAGERFMRRQIKTHLSIEPEKLSKKNLPQLVDWVRLAFAVLTNDKKEVNEFSKALLELSKSARSN